MVKSMTAFSRIEKTERWGVVAIEFRTVNHRYADIKIRLPDEVANLEMIIRELIAGKVFRGKLDCAISLKFSSSDELNFSLNIPLIDQLNEAMGEVKRRVDVQAISALEVLKWPGVCERPVLPLEDLKPILLESVKEGLVELVEARVREGGKIRELIVTRCQAMADEIAKVRAALPQIRKGFKEKLEARLETVQESMDADRLEQEIVLFAQRMDVDEELDRLGVHINEVLRILETEEPMGRRLDFLMQELNREANTLGSKSVSVETTQSSVEMKVLIEQMREQIQNIE